MPVQMSGTFETDLVTPRTLNTIRRNMNEATGKDVVRFVVAGKFRPSAYSEHPGVVRRRSQKYAAWKLKKVGHATPNVLSGRTRALLSTPGPHARITKTANGGRVYLKAPPHIKAWRESTRQEMEAVSPRQRDMLARRQEEFFGKAINDPKNRRKRRVRSK